MHVIMISDPVYDLYYGEFEYEDEDEECLDISSRKV